MATERQVDKTTWRQNDKRQGHEVYNKTDLLYFYNRLIHLFVYIYVKVSFDFNLFLIIRKTRKKPSF